MKYCDKCNNKIIDDKGHIFNKDDYYVLCLTITIKNKPINLCKKCLLEIINF